MLEGPSEDFELVLDTSKARPSCNMCDVKFRSISFLVNLHLISCARHLYTSRSSFLTQYCIRYSPGMTLLSRGNSKLGIHSASAEKQSRFWRLGRS